ncbi:cupin domain-containing protein [Nocardia sp. SYP-A9097]|uniref:cupin domain-containing protein n=1 Tax=Nocardia sp. SYP-A9097 TaxID=2663237 RepID=UPI001E59A6F4|nr:cupin domain-containing protein [Nocardia sp. SYP-A9097]
MEKINIAEVIATLPGPFQPRDLATPNDSVIRLARLHGEFPWHHHDEDELFLCWDGTFRLDLQDHAPITLHPGEIFVVPAGLEHRPVAATPAHVLMIERPETKQHGN